MSQADAVASDQGPDAREQKGQTPAHHWQGDGEMGRRTSDFDWSKNPVGPVAQWPQSLKIAVSTILNSRYPMFVWWGRRLTNFYNDAYTPMLGKRHPDALGRPAAEVWSDVWPVVGPQAEAVLNEGQATWNEEKLLVMERNGYTEEAYFTFSYSPLPDDDGSVGGIFCAVTEDTGRVLSQRRLRTLREVAAMKTEYAKSAETACQAAARILAGNPYDLPFVLIYLLDADANTARLAGSAGLPEGSPAAAQCVSLIAPASEAWWPIGDVLRSGDAEVVADLGKRFGLLPGGAWPEATKQAIVVPLAKPGQTQLAGCIVAGVSPRLELNEAYRTFYELLSVGVATVVANARAYEEARRRAEALAELDRAKTVFFSNVSHEFRTPLTLMLGPIEDELRENPAPGSRQRLEVAHRNCLRLLKLVNSLLDFARIEAGRIEASYEPVDLATFTADLASVFRSAIEKAGLRLVVDCRPAPEPVYVDREMWEKIVLNLLSNAFKFTFEGQISVVLALRGDRVELSVADTGVGIPDAELPKVFERFHRVRGSRSRTHEGTGIGLSLVLELARLHGGHVTVRSEEGRGSTFTVSICTGKEHLPADRIRAARQLSSTALGAKSFVEKALRWLPDNADTGQPGSPPAELVDDALSRQDEAAPVPPARLLVVDDNADMREYLRRILCQHYQVETAGDGQTALAQIRARPPELVVTDVMMPGLDGFELLQCLRAEERTRGIPVILVSARAGEESRVEGMEAGADDYLIKPFSARELVARVGAQIHLAAVRQSGMQVLTESQECLRKSNEELAARLAQLNDVNAELVLARREALGLMDEALRARELVEKSRDALREADRRKDEFLAMLAHELRNPLAPVMMGLELLNRVDPNDPVAIEARESMQRQTKQMVRLIDDLLDISRISRGKIELKRECVELSSIIHQAAEAGRSLAESAGHRLTISIPDEEMCLTADPARLAQVFGNLLNNACRYTNEGGQITLTARRELDTAIVSVADNGIGIPPEKLEDIFNIFSQVDRKLERTAGGLGIGLHLVKRLVELHGGSVWARSDGPGKGSEILVRLPLATECDQAEQP